MWYLQTPVDALMLPTDANGRSTLAGNVTAWQHVVRTSSHLLEEREAVCNAPVRWTIWESQQTARRMQVPDALAHNESLAFMVRAQPGRACIWANFPPPGKRKSDQTIEVVIVVPPEHVARYESLVRFAMTLPSGYVAFTLPVPAVSARAHVGARELSEALITPGSATLLEGLEIVVSRARPQKFSRSDMRADRRTTPLIPAPGELLHDEDDDWLLFAAAPPAPVNATSIAMDDVMPMVSRAAVSEQTVPDTVA